MSKNKNKEEKPLETAEPVENETTLESEGAETEKTAKKAPFRGFNSRKKINVRSLKHGSLSVILTVIFVAAVVVANIIASVLSDRFGVSADLTGGSLYTLDETTKLYLENTLVSDITVTVLNSEQTFEQAQATRQVSEILKKMENASGHIRLEFLNLDQNPNYVSRFKGETLDTDYIVIESEKTGRHRVITPIDYFGLTTEEALAYYSYYGYVAQYQIEQEAVGAMMFVSDENPVRVAFTEGYGEGDSSALKSLLEKNGFGVETINLLTATEIDPEIDFVVVYAPSIDIGNEQLAKLDRFLDNNGAYNKNVLYFAAVTQPETPNIDAFLRDWSLSVGFYNVGLTDPNYLISPLTYYAYRLEICDTVYTSGVYGSPLYTLGADVRPVFVEDNGKAETSVLMKTFDGAFLLPINITNDEEFDINNAQRGEFNAVVAAIRKSTDGTASRVFAIGSDMLSSGYFMSYTNGNNSEFFVELFDKVSGKDAGIVIKAKSPVDLSFEMNAKTARTLAVTLCLVIPVCVIAAGLTVWIRRRHR